MSKTKLDEKEIKHLAKLAGVELTSEEIKKYQEQLSETLDYIENLKELDVSKTEPTTSPIDSKNIYFKDGEKNQRLLTEDQVFQNAKNKKSNQFTVKKIL